MKNLNEMLQRWASDGLITFEQARDIERTEKERAARTETTPALAEVVAYAGAMCLLSGAFVIASRIWPGISEMQQLLLLAAGTILLWAGGWRTRRDPRAALQRLTTGLWFLSVGGAGWLALAMADHLLELDDTSLLVGISTSLYAGALYVKRRTALQQVALAGGVAYLCAGLSPDLGQDTNWVGGFLWIGGAAWIFFTRAEILTPRRTGYALGALGVLVGSEVVAIEFFESLEWWGLALGLVSSTGLLCLSIALRQMVLLGLGTAGLFVFLIQVISEYLADGLGGPLTFFVAGALLLILALVTMRLRSRVATN